MSWERRQGNLYYYRVQRGTNGRLVKHYFGTGPAAQRAAQADDHKRALRKQAQIDQQQVHHLETQLTALTNIVHTFVAASFWGSGFHPHSRQWRKWRHAPLPQEGALHMQENPLPVEPGTSYDSLKSLVQQAQAGDTDTLPLIRRLLDQVPELWDDSRVLARQVERSWVNALSGSDLVSKEIIDREVQALRSQLLGPQPTSLEKLLVDRICVCWLAIQHAELHAARRFNERAVVLTPSEEHRLDKVHHRFLTAVRELARVRKLLQPTTKFQVNIGTHQLVA